MDENVSQDIPISFILKYVDQRPLKKLVLFDVDETLTPARRVRTHFVLHSYSRLTIENVVRVT